MDWLMVGVVAVGTVIGRALWEAGCWWSRCRRVGGVVTKPTRVPEIRAGEEWTDLPDFFRSGRCYYATVEWSAPSGPCGIEVPVYADKDKGEGIPSAEIVRIAKGTAMRCCGAPAHARVTRVYLPAKRGGW